MQTRITGARIALGYKSRVGKDTFASAFVSEHGGRVLRFASTLYEIVESNAKKLGKSTEKNPAALQLIGEGYRVIYGENVWLESVLSQIDAADPDDNILVVDMRYKNEMVALKERGFLCVNIIREDRPIDRNQNHRSETELDGAVFDCTILNNGTYVEFISTVRALVRYYYEEEQ